MEKSMNLNQSLLVGASGRALFGVGGENAYRTHEYKGYRVSLEWDENDGEPMLLIWPAATFLEREGGVFGIGLSSAGRYADPSGKPAPDCATLCAAALPTLNKAMLPIEVHCLMDVVLRFIPDLILMPPCPRKFRLGARGEALMDITQTDAHGKVLSEVSI
jgi:hypothetical protein